MKKQKQFSKRGFFCEDGNNAWCVDSGDNYLYIRILDIDLFIGQKEKKRFKKFVKALKKGLKRLG